MAPRWLGRQFEQHLPGMEPAPKAAMTRRVQLPNSAEHQALQSETVKRVAAVHYQRSTASGGLLPVGMRGSIPEREALSHRLDRKAQGQARWGSLQARMEDEDGGNDDDYDDYEPPGAHPTTGLPERGTMNTFHQRGDRSPHLGFEEGHVPHDLSFHGSAPSARRKHGSVEEIPMQGLATVQRTVSMGRVHEALDNPTTTASPRFPASHKELPHVYEDAGKYTMIDGNHRASAHMIGNQMFMQANVLRNKDIPAVSASTSRISRAKTNATHNPKVDADEVESRLMRNVYGTGNY